MFLRKLALISCLIFWVATFAQEIPPIASIPQNLRDNANAVIRSSQTAVNITGRRAMTIKREHTVTIFSEAGLKYIDAVEWLSGSTSVKNVELSIFGADGELIKKIKRKDFKEQSVSEGSIITDDKVLYYEYLPLKYPFTAKYTSEVTTSNTAFIPSWSPVEGYNVSVEKCSLNITALPELGLRHKVNDQNNMLAKREIANGLSATAENIPAVVREDYSPSFNKITPHILFGLTNFHLEGIDGEAKDWANFGAWMYKHLLTGTDELPETTIAAIKQRVGSETDALKKAKIVYEYVQAKTRYVSIQLGIGGWKPMLAKDVDRLGYGDCKALTNYTRALLKAVGVNAVYTVVYAGSGKQDITPDFVSMQGNHVILGIPNNNTITWLECTSQIAPFGFQGDFTDDRMVLMITPEKGELVRTFVYDTKLNTQDIKGHYTIAPTGTISGNFQRISKGIQYDDKYYLEKRPHEDIVKHYKEDFGYIHNLKLKKAEINNNKNNQELTENIAFDGDNYWNISGNKYMFSVNAFNKSGVLPQRYRNRKSPFVIERGFYDVDEVTINLPEGYTIEAKPENVTINNKFGEYKIEYIYEPAGKITYKRVLAINNGSYTSDEYENYRLFREKVMRNDNAKIVLIKN